MPKKYLKKGKSAKYQSDSGSDTESNYSRNMTEDDLDSEVDPIEHHVNYNIQAIQTKPLSDLTSYLNNPKILNESGDTTTNIIDRLNLKCYNIPNNKIAKFFYYLDVCRKDKIRVMFSEKQQEYSGIMLDFDIYQDEEDDQLTDAMFNILIQKVITLLIKLLEFKERKETIFVGITRRPQIKYSDDRGCFKDGFHLIIPGVQVTRGVKKLIIKKLIEQELIDQIMSEVEPADIKERGRAYQRSDFLDIASSYVPTFFIGSSTKKGHSPYFLTHAYEVTATIATGDIFIVSNDKLLRGKRCNICHEFSLNWEAPRGIIKKKTYEVNDRYQTEASNLGMKNKANEDEIINNFGELSTNAIHDHQIKEIKDILDILNITRAERYNTWRDVIFALANTSISYKHLAEYFSRKAKNFDYVGFEKLWDTAVRGLNNDKKQFTLGSIYYWAKQDSPQKYEELRKNNVFGVLYNMVYECYKEGILSHADISQILYKLLKHKFIVDIPEGEKYKVWYEFILDDDPHIEGELYKWRKWQGLPSSLSKYISHILPKLFEKVFTHVKKNYEKADGDISKYYGKVLNNFKATMRKLGDRNFKRNVIQEAEDMFFSRGFSMSLDVDPLIRGVQNGVLKLPMNPNGKPTLIQGYHSHKVSKYTEVPYIAFDPRDPLTKQIITTLRNMFPDEEPDSFEFTMSYLSSTIDGNPKESMFMIMTGSGANGKSFLVELHKSAIGSTYGVKMPLSYLTCKSSHADNATPAVMQLKDASFAYYSESNRHEKLNAARVKEVTGLETIAGRKLHQDMINFKPRCHHLVTTNYDFDVECNDHGTWRRIEYNPLKITFKDPVEQKLDPENPYEREADPRVTQVWTESPEVRGRYLGFMVWMRHKLYSKYKGKVKAVPHPHIQFETERYRRRQDMISAFLAERFVKCASDDNEENIMEYSMAEQVQTYVSWYALNNGNSIPAKGLVDQFQNSQIGKYIKRTARGNRLVGHRFLKNNEELAEGEEYALKNIFALEKPADNFGIQRETSDQYYERVCREYDEVKHLFSNEAKYDVDTDTLVDYHIVGGNADYDKSYNERKQEIEVPSLPERKNNTQEIDGVILPSGIVLSKLEEPSRNYLTDEYHNSMCGFLDNMGDMEVIEYDVIDC